MLLWDLCILFMVTFQAIINCLLNRVEIDIGSDLQAYKDFTAGLPAELKGLALDDVKRVRNAHNSFAR